MKDGFGGLVQGYRATLGGMMFSSFVLFGLFSFYNLSIFSFLWYSTLIMACPHLHLKLEKFLFLPSVVVCPHFYHLTLVPVYTHKKNYFLKMNRVNVWLSNRLYSPTTTVRLYIKATVKKEPGSPNIWVAIVILSLFLSTIKKYPVVTFYRHIARGINELLMFPCYCSWCGETKYLPTRVSLGGLKWQ